MHSQSGLLCRLYMQKAHHPSMVRCSYIDELVLNVGHQCNVTCSLDSNSQSSLMFCTVSGDSSRKDLSSLGNVSFQFVNILVIDLVILFATEYANFLSSASASSLHGRIAFLCFIVSHGGNLLHLVER